MTVLCLQLCVLAGQTPTASDRTAFDFLVGTWELGERIDHARRTTERGDDRYVFRQPIRGGAIEATWRFNRGTRDKPDYADALYISGYHEPSSSWSFYYVSERSAQHWRGRQANGRWYFYFDEPFEYEGRKAVQRQWWEPVDATSIRRHIENSYDDGHTWTPVVTSVLRRSR
jgi:hypothetical protein